jgi:hypothetical protein
MAARRKRRLKPKVIETTQERHQRIADEAEHLINLKVWPDEIAVTLGYANAGNLCTKLRSWGYVTLSERFNRVNFDGLVAPSHLTTYERRRGAAV